VPETFTTTISTVVDNQTYREDLVDTGNAVVQCSPSVPVAKIGQLTTRTDANTGTLTMTTGHGITTGATIIIFWTGGSRRSVVGTVSVISVPIDLGAGTDLPANLTAITAMVPVSVTTGFPGDTPQGIAVKSPVAGWVGWYDNTLALIKEYFVDAGEGDQWAFSSGDANPLSGAAATINSIKFAHGSSASAQTMTAVAVYNG